MLIVEQAAWTVHARSPLRSEADAKPPSTELRQADKAGERLTRAADLDVRFVGNIF